MYAQFGFGLEFHNWLPMVIAALGWTIVSGIMLIRALGRLLYEVFVLALGCVGCPALALVLWGTESTPHWSILFSFAALVAVSFFPGIDRLVYVKTFFIGGPLLISVIAVRWTIAAFGGFHA